VLSAVGEVAAMYSSIAENAVDSRISVRSCTLSRRGDAAPLSGIVEPSSPLTLDLTIGINAHLPRTRVGFEVVRNDGLVMFHGTPMADGAPAMQLSPGEELSLRINFCANVLRGTYRISLHLADTNRLWEQIDISGLVSFVVHETTRVTGCAELNPKYEIDVGASRAPVGAAKIGV
jgi:hypothetical protein